MRVMLDSNALDPVLDTAGAFEALDHAAKSGKLQILFTHVTVDEIAAVPELERRQQLLLLLIGLGRLIETSGMVLDESRLGFCRLMPDDDQSFEPLRSGNVRHSRDALIAHTALNEECTDHEREATRLPSTRTRS